MKKIVLFVVTILFLGKIEVASQELSPYLEVGKVNAKISEVAQTVKNSLRNKGFSIIGEYHPEKRSDLYVIAYTRKDLYNLCLKVKNRGILAAVLKVGMVYSNGTTTVSMINPDYLFNAYLREDIVPFENRLHEIGNEARNALSSIGKEFEPFGGNITKEKLRHYRYMMGMQTFNDPVELKTFRSFEEGVEIINKNLAAHKSKTEKVYSLTFKNSKVAVFGVALNDPEKGEAHFLPIIGEKHIAAMPYEIVLMDNKATMLHGRFRIALHWPSLTMRTFTKIMSTPGDIEDMLKSVCE